jgi:hypothetical protein
MTAKNFRVKHGLDVGDVQNVITTTGGVATFFGTVQSEGATTGNITTGLVDDQTITTNSGDLVLDSFSGQIDITSADLNIGTGVLQVNTISSNDSTAINIQADVEFVNANIRIGGMLISQDGFDNIDSTNISFNGSRLSNVEVPTNTNDVATKGYVDDNQTRLINDLTNVDADTSNMQDGDILVVPLTDSSTNLGFSLSSQLTAGIRIPSGTTAQRPVIYEGMFRLNSETNNYEGSINGSSVQEFLVSEIILNSDVDSAVEQVDGFPSATYRSAEYMYTVENSDTGEYQTGKIMVVHDGTNAYHSEYGKVITGSNDLVTFTSGLSGGSVLLFASAQAPNSVFKAKRISMEVA